MNRYRRPLAIILIFVISLTVGLLVDLCWSSLERVAYPQKYSEYVEKYSKEFNIPEDLIYATIKVESSFEPEAISRAGARGLMQLMPSTFEWLTSDEHLGEHLTPNMLYDPETNIRYGVYYLKYLYTKFGYNGDLVSAAYNGGEGNVAEWLLDERYADGDGGLRDYPDDFDETKNYVKKIRKTRETYQKLYY
ncbi:MAG: lytic transglycosylase domain-containing protein [Clostridia bacterium]|nr:lytic transglycosylase domain-containing protein [Clostridia bacterium]